MKRRFAHQHAAAKKAKEKAHLLFQSLAAEAHISETYVSLLSAKACVKAAHAAQSAGRRNCLCRDASESYEEHQAIEMKERSWRTAPYLAYQPGDGQHLHQRWHFARVFGLPGVNSSNRLDGSRLQNALLFAFDIPGARAVWRTVAGKLRGSRSFGATWRRRVTPGRLGTSSSADRRADGCRDACRGAIFAARIVGYLACNLRARHPFLARLPALLRTALLYHAARHGACWRARKTRRRSGGMDWPPAYLHRACRLHRVAAAYCRALAPLSHICIRTAWRRTSAALRATAWRISGSGSSASGDAQAGGDVAAYCGGACRHQPWRAGLRRWKQRVRSALAASRQVCRRCAYRAVRQRRRFWRDGACASCAASLASAYLTASSPYLAI